MKYFLLLCLCMITSCSEKKVTSQDPATKTLSDTSDYQDHRVKYEKYIERVGMTHVLEHQLEGYKLKASIVNSLHSLLFYYNEENEQVCFYADDEMVGANKESLVFRINEKNLLPPILYFLTTNDENSKLVPVDYTNMTEEKHEQFNPPGMPVAYGFKLKQTDTFHFSITYIWLQVIQEVTVSYDPNTGWQSNASEISLDFKGITANVFAFGKETIIDQLRKVPNEDEKCIIRTKPHPSNRYTLKLDLDSDYDDFNTYSVEVEIKQKEIVVNGKTVNIRELQQIIDDNSEPGYSTDVRINLTNSSDEQRVRELFDYLREWGSNAKYSIGIK